MEEPKCIMLNEEPDSARGYMLYVLYISQKRQNYRDREQICGC